MIYIKPPLPDGERAGVRGKKAPQASNNQKHTIPTIDAQYRNTKELRVPLCLRDFVVKKFIDEIEIGVLFPLTPTLSPLGRESFLKGNSLVHQFK